MEANADLSTPPDGLTLYHNSCQVWENAYKGACKRLDELLAEVSYLHLELAGVRNRNLCLTRENRRLTLTLKHLVSLKHDHAAFAHPYQVPWASVTPPLSRDASNTGEEGEQNEQMEDEDNENIEPINEHGANP
jgi:hypothetical protein